MTFTISDLKNALIPFRKELTFSATPATAGFIFGVTLDASAVDTEQWGFGM